MSWVTTFGVSVDGGGFSHGVGEYFGGSVAHVHVLLVQDSRRLYIFVWRLSIRVSNFNW